MADLSHTLTGRPLMGRALGVALFIGLATSLIAAPFANSASGLGAPRPTTDGTAAGTAARMARSQAPESLATLYDQYNSAGSNATSSQNFEQGLDEYDDWAADDFVVPPGMTWWVVDGVDVQGAYFNGPGPAASVNVYFYTNGNGNLPGTLYTYQLNIGVGFGPSFELPISPVVLVPGTYWVLVQANQDNSPFGQWGWTNRTVTSNAGAAWLNPGGGFGGLCRNWGRRSTDCGIDPAAPDQVYRLRGTAACNGELATIVGTSGNDTMNGTNGPDVIVGLDGHDQINGHGGEDYICGGTGDDRIVGGDETSLEGDRLFGDTGNDVIDAGQGYIDLVDGGPGNDQLTGNPFSVVSYLSAPGGVTVDLARGTASGAAGNDTLNGFPFVFGSNDHDTLIGDRSTNIFFANGGNDTVRGAEGVDVLGFASDSEVRANLATGQSLGEGDDRLIEIEGLFSGEGNDELIGSRQDNFLSGGGGHNVIRGGGGADSIYAEGGSDRLFGEAGNDLLEGGAGVNQLDGGPGQNDEASYAWIPSGVAGQTGVTADLTAGSATAGGNVGLRDSLSGVESLTGSDYPDTLRGNSKGNALAGNAGTDRLLGGAGNDFLNGGPHADNGDAGRGRLDYCLDAERTVRCEMRARTSGGNASARAFQTPLLDTLLTGAPFLRGWPEGASVQPASLVESKDEPTCAPRRGGGGVTTIAPPKKIKGPSGNGKVQWQASLYRRGGGRVGKPTPLAQGSLVGPASRPGSPAAWTRANGTPIPWPKRITVTRPGIYYWKQTVTLKDLGPGGTGVVVAHYTPPRTASARPYCDFRG